MALVRFQAEANVLSFLKKEIIRKMSYISPSVTRYSVGRYWQLLQEHEYLQNTATLRFLVIDEADRMVSLITLSYQISRSLRTGSLVTIKTFANCSFKLAHFVFF